MTTAMIIPTAILMIILIMIIVTRTTITITRTMIMRIAITIIAPIPTIMLIMSTATITKSRAMRMTSTTTNIATNTAMGRSPQDKPEPLPAPPGQRTASRTRSPVQGRSRNRSEPVSAVADHAALFRLMTWFSPSFPVGAFSYSSGIEWAVEAGDVTDAKTLQDWLSCMLSDGAGFCDAVFLAHAYRNSLEGAQPALSDVAELAAAFVPSRERHLETMSQGRAFIEIARQTWPCAALDRLLGLGLTDIAYPVAIGVVSAGHAAPLESTMHAFLHALTANWISAGVRLIPLGQTDGQRVLAGLETAIRQTACRALQASLDELGSATFRADIAGMRHEAQYTRLFRS